MRKVLLHGSRRSLFLKLLGGTLILTAAALLATGGFLYHRQTAGARAFLNDLEAKVASIPVSEGEFESLLPPPEPGPSRSSVQAATILKQITVAPPQVSRRTSIPAPEAPAIFSAQGPVYTSENGAPALETTRASEVTPKEAKVSYTDIGGTTARFPARGLTGVASGQTARPTEEQPTSPVRVQPPEVVESSAQEASSQEMVTLTRASVGQETDPKMGPVRVPAAPAAPSSKQPYSTAPPTAPEASRQKAPTDGMLQPAAVTLAEAGEEAATPSDASHPGKDRRNPMLENGSSAPPIVPGLHKLAAPANVIRVVSGEETFTFTPANLESLPPLGSLPRATKIRIPAIDLISSIIPIELENQEGNWSYVKPDGGVGLHPTAGNPGEGARGWYFGHYSQIFYDRDGSNFDRLPKVVDMISEGQTIEIILETEGSAYLYQVVGRPVIVEANEFNTGYFHDNQYAPRPEIVLVTCIPPPTWTHRLLITARLAGVGPLP